MQSITHYRAEYSALKARNCKLHEEIWCLTQEHMTDTQKEAIYATLDEIEANQRRMHIIKRLIHWLRDFLSDYSNSHV